MLYSMFACPPASPGEQLVACVVGIAIGACTNEAVHAWHRACMQKRVSDAATGIMRASLAAFGVGAWVNILDQECTRHNRVVALLDRYAPAPAAGAPEAAAGAPVPPRPAA